MKLTYLTLLLVLNTLFVFAQRPYAMKGSVTDSMATYKLVNTSIVLLNKKDSTLVKYTRADTAGNFNLGGLRPGKFMLLITYPGYADYTEDFVLDSLHPVKDFGPINLILKSTLLEGVIIKGKAAAITIKGDTTEFNAGSYNLPPNAKVEDLLKQLPGIQVDKDGKITAQGQKVNKVLVDGEEFFGDDPTLVTKNLRGDMVDKVQLYDKKSDQATFTGIDDGEKSKTINIKLKEDKKNGYFGKAEVGGGTRDFYKGQVTANIFKGKQKASVYGSTGNTGESLGNGMSYDVVEFMDGSGAMGMAYSMSSDDFDMGGGGAGGIPVNKNAGFHYENKWKDKYGINSNYKLGSVRTKGEAGSLSINTLPNGNMTTASNQQSDNFSFSQKLDGTFNMQIDSTSNLKVTVSGSLKNTNSDDTYNASTQRENESFLNKNIRTITNEGNNKGVSATAFWTKKLKKKGRTLSVNLKQSVNENTSSGFLNSENRFFNEQNQLDSTVNIDQFKTSKILKSAFSSNATYTEPLSKSLSMILNYGLNIDNSSSDKRSFNKDAAGNYDDLDLKFSNNFDLDQMTNNGGFNFNYKKGKSILNFGTRLTAVQFKQFDRYEDRTLKRNFINWAPQIGYSYNFSRSASLRVNYNGNTSQPSMEQIQPYRANTNPLYIVLGNPDLRPSFSSNINISYNSFKMLSEQNLWISGNFSFTSNAISSNTVTDDAGITTTQAINLNNKTPINFMVMANMGRKIKGINLQTSANVSGNQSYSISNGILNTSKSLNYSLGPTVRYYKEKFNFSLNLSPGYNTSSSTLRGIKTSNNSWGANGNFDTGLTLPGSIEIGTDGTYQYTGKSQTFNESLNRLIWDAYISKKFMKSKDLVLTLTGKDLLNQNSGFSRSVSGNMINQNTYTTIRRYFMLSLSWDFNKMGVL
ncbi:outer membrane beta-barrel family protein [Pedobacter africanus]|uniref:Outer membrane receptor proteins, mostly Fe transport n=1 Tax=Pedobacter africanus TaxID=151894 RepID=A0A1W2BGP6_9SPHI|nr:outer membrane beta-barrel family protein [Pedobacter africanus]SMC72024.1 Outer membrane receptor proteins, mostly Fe transport [Pedobacter africanus]